MLGVSLGFMVGSSELGLREENLPIDPSSQFLKSKTRHQLSKLLNWLRVDGHPYTQQPMATTETHQWQQTTQTKPTDLIKERDRVKKRERERRTRGSLREERERAGT